MVVMESALVEVAGATTVEDGATVVKVVTVVSQDVEVVDDACVVVDDCEVVTAGGVCRIGNRSLLFRGSRADCDDKLKTELQLIERLLSSSLL